MVTLLVGTLITLRPYKYSSLTPGRVQHLPVKPDFPRSYLF